MSASSVVLCCPSNNFATQSGPHVSEGTSFGPTLMKSRAKLPFESFFPHTFVVEMFPEHHTPPDYNYCPKSDARKSTSALYLTLLRAPSPWLV